MFSKIAIAIDILTHDVPDGLEAVAGTLDRVSEGLKELADFARTGGHGKLFATAPGGAEPPERAMLVALKARCEAAAPRTASAASAAPAAGLSPEVRRQLLDLFAALIGRLLSH